MNIIYLHQAGNERFTKQNKSTISEQLYTVTVYVDASCDII